MAVALRKYFWVLRALLRKPQFGGIGSMTYLGKPGCISGAKNITLGSRVRIYPGAVLEAAQGGTIRVGSDVSIGQNLCIRSLGGTVSVGEQTTVSGNVLITNAEGGEPEALRMLAGVEPEHTPAARDTVIGGNCFIGYGAAILAGARLGKHCVVGTNAVVTAGEYPDYCVLVGNPARIIKQYDPDSGQWKRI